MNFRQKIKIVNALLQCENISNPGIRNDIVKQLPEDIKNNIERRPQNRSDVINIVDACQAYPDGMEKLIDIVDYYEGESIAFLAVKNLLGNQLMPGIIDQKYKFEIFSIVSGAGLTINEVKDIYILSLPESIFPRVDSKSIWAMLDHLWDIPEQEDGLYPIISFIYYLSEYIKPENPDIDKKLKKKNALIAEELGIEKAKFNSLTKKIKKNQLEASSWPYLLIEIHPDQANQLRPRNKKYLVHISLWQDKDNTRYLYKEDDLYLLNDIPKVINTYINKLAKILLDKITDLIIEFFLPRELISLEVDQWMKEDTFVGKIKIGNEHKVVVRSLERALDPELQGYWRKKWKKLCYNKTLAPIANSIDFVSDNQQEPLALYYNITQNEPLACLGFNFTPKDNNDGYSILGAILRAGIPIALWPRKKAASYIAIDIVDIEIPKLLSHNKLNFLLEETKKFRIEATVKGNEKHLGNYLTLLWDDPERLPLEFDNRIDTQFHAI